MFFGMNGEKHSLFIYGERLYFRQGGQNSFFEIPALRKWHNFVLSWDALKRIVSYSSDGVQLAENTDYRENGLGSGTLKFGNSDIGYSYFFNGSIDDIRIYDRALSAEKFGCFTKWRRSCPLSL